MADATTGGAGAATVAPQATVDTGTSFIDRMSAVYSTDNFTCDTTVRDLLSKRIFQSRPGDVAVQFQSENFSGCRILLSLTRNGAVVPGPGDAASPMAIHDTRSQLSTNGFNFVDNNVRPGFYTYSVRCQCDRGTNLVDERSMVILHR
jgi:hypothetical protein